MTEREQEIISMRTSGLSYREIGEKLGISSSRVLQIYNKTPEGKNEKTEKDSLSMQSIFTQFRESNFKYSLILCDIEDAEGEYKKQLIRAKEEFLTTAEDTVYMMLKEKTSRKYIRCKELEIIYSMTLYKDIEKMRRRWMN